MLRCLVSNVSDYGTAFLVKVVCQKNAREIWNLNKRYSTAEAVVISLAKVFVPHDGLSDISGAELMSSRASRYRMDMGTAEIQHPDARSTWTWHHGLLGSSGKQPCAPPLWMCTRCKWRDPR